MSDKKNPCVFLDLSIDGSPAERIVVELFADEMPKTAENFRALCTGEMGTRKPLHYKGTVFHRIYSGVFAEGGDFSNENGESIYGGLFADEECNVRRIDCGVLTVHPFNNGFKFYIHFDFLPGLAGAEAVFGKVIEGMETVKKIDKLGTLKGKPSRQVKITNCGEIPEEDKKKYVMESDKGKKKKTRKRAKPSNYVSEFYSSRRKYSKSNKSSDSDSEFYSSLLVKIRDCGDFRGKKENTGKKAISSDESSDGPVKKKQRVSTVGDEENYWSSGSSEVYAAVLVEFTRACRLAEDEKNNVMESDKGKKEKTASSDESSDERAYWSSKSPNYVLEFYSSKRKYWSSNLGLVKNGEIPEDKNNNVMESDKGKKKKTGKREKSSNSDSDCYPLKRMYEQLYSKSPNSYSSD